MTSLLGSNSMAKEVVYSSLALVGLAPNTIGFLSIGHLDSSQ